MFVSGKWMEVELTVTLLTVTLISRSFTWKLCHKLPSTITGGITRSLSLLLSTTSPTLSSPALA